MKKVLILIIILHASICFSGNTQLEEKIAVEPPVEFESMGLYTDGGSVGFSFKDKKGTKIDFSFDGRIGTNTEGELFYGSEHPSKGTLVKRNSPLCMQLIQILEQFVYSTYSESDLERIQGSKVTNLKEKERLISIMIFKIDS